MNTRFEVFDEHTSVCVITLVLLFLCVPVCLCHLFLFLIVFPPSQMFPFHIADS